MSTVQKHFVTFYSPGTFVAEESTKSIDGWCVETARAMIPTIKERYGAVPYGFRFTTRSRGPDDLDSKQTATSPFYWLGGTVETLAEVELREPGSILASNMRCNNLSRVITNNNSWRWTQPLSENDVVLEWP